MFCSLQKAALPNNHFYLTSNKRTIFIGRVIKQTMRNETNKKL